jgi:hypothetical protein
MLLPPLENNYSTTLFPDTPKSMIINVHTPEIKLSSDKLTTIELNVSYMDPIDNTKKTITQEHFQFTSSKTIETDDPGTYLLEFYSEVIVEVTIEGEGIYTYTIVVILSLLILDAVLISRNYLLDLNL